MLQVTFEQEDYKLTLELKGHAGQADIGQDIVCASCSILAYTVAQLVKEAEASGYLKTKPKVMLESGDAVISCEPKAEWISDIQKTYLFAEKGYELLSRNYPQYVELKPFSRLFSH